MRVCHVSPHLPPDQAANALLPAELAAWAHAQGHQVTLVAHEPAQGQAAVPLPTGQVWRLPRKPKTTGLARALRLDTLRQARVISAALVWITPGCVTAMFRSVVVIGGTPRPDSAPSASSHG